MRPSPRRGFTLTELLVVIAIIAGMAGLLAMGWAKMSAKKDIDATKLLVQQVAAAMANYPVTRWALSGTTVDHRPLWDLNDDTYLDENSALNPSGGFVSMTRSEIPQRFMKAGKTGVTSSTNILIDAWGKKLPSDEWTGRLHVVVSKTWTGPAINALKLAPEGIMYGVYSEGPNRTDDSAADASDDIRSW